MITEREVKDFIDDAKDGACCSLCAEYFVKEQNFPGNEGEPEYDAPVLYSHGYPVACEQCWEEGCGYEKAEVKTEKDF